MPAWLSNYYSLVTYRKLRLLDMGYGGLIELVFYRKRGIILVEIVYCTKVLLLGVELYLFFLFNEINTVTGSVVMHASWPTGKRWYDFDTFAYPCQIVNWNLVPQERTVWICTKLWILVFKKCKKNSYKERLKLHHCNYRKAFQTVRGACSGLGRPWVEAQWQFFSQWPPFWTQDQHLSSVTWSYKFCSVLARSKHGYEGAFSSFCPWIAVAKIVVGRGQPRWNGLSFRLCSRGRYFLLVVLSKIRLIFFLTLESRDCLSHYSSSFPGKRLSTVFVVQIQA